LLLVVDSVSQDDFCFAVSQRDKDQQAVVPVATPKPPTVKQICCEPSMFRAVGCLDHCNRQLRARLTFDTFPQTIKFCHRLVTNLPCRINDPTLGARVRDLAQLLAECRT